MHNRATAVNSFSEFETWVEADIRERHISRHAGNSLNEASIKPPVIPACSGDEEHQFLKTNKALPARCCFKSNYDL